MKKEKFAKVLRIAKLWMYPLIAVFGMISYFKTWNRDDMILVWIAIVGMEVIVQGQKETDKDKDHRNAALSAELEEENNYIEQYKRVAQSMRDKLKSEIERLKEEITRLNQENATYARDYETHARIIREQTERIKKLSADIEAMTLKAKGMVEKKEWKEFPNYFDLVAKEPGCAVCGKKGPHQCEPPRTDHGTAEVLRELLAEVTPEPRMVIGIEVNDMPDWQYEPLPEVTEENTNEMKTAIPIAPATPSESTPDFNHTAVETTEEATPGKESSKKKNQKWYAEHFTRYIEMIKTGSSRDAVIEKMIEDLHVSKTTGMALYYKWVKSSAPIPELVKHVPPAPEPKVNKATPVEREPEVKPAPPKPKPAPRISSLPVPILKKLDAMPEYPTVIQFKDAVCMMHEMSQYSVAQLKLAYKETHKNLTW